MLPRTNRNDKQANYAAGSAPSAVDWMPRLGGSLRTCVQVDSDIVFGPKFGVKVTRQLFGTAPMPKACRTERAPLFPARHTLLDGQLRCASVLNGASWRTCPTATAHLAVESAPMFRAQRTQEAAGAGTALNPLAISHTPRTISWTPMGMLSTKFTVVKPKA